jgi:hypothetical protein
VDEELRAAADPQLAGWTSASPAPAGEAIEALTRMSRDFKPAFATAFESIEAILNKKISAAATIPVSPRKLLMYGSESAD